MEYELVLGTRELIKEFGVVGDVENTAKVYDPRKGSSSSSSNVCKALMYVSELTLQSNGTSLRYGTQFKTGDKEVYIVPSTPSLGDCLPISPGDTSIHYKGKKYTVAATKVYDYKGVTFLITAYLRQ